MPKTLAVLTLAAFLSAPSASAAMEQASGRLLAVLPTDGLDEGSVFAFRDQAALDAHYYLADETVLGLDGTAEAVLASYRAGPGQALLLVVAFAADDAARRAYERFGADFFFDRFDKKRPRTVERIETGDYAAAARTGSFLIIVLEAPDRKSCDELVRRAEERAAASR
jgi:hypothetical protein